VRRLLIPALLLLMISGPVMAQDDIRRERQGEYGPAQDRLESRVAPALRVTDWMNISGEDLRIEDLSGNVVVLNFWATW